MSCCSNERYDLTGHGDVTNPNTCGKGTSRIFGCLNVAEHGAQFDKDGKLTSHSGKVYVRHIVMSCNKPSCPICRNRWGAKEAKRMADCLLEASKHYGKVEHVVLSPPRWDWELGGNAIQRKSEKVAYSRGIIGAALVYHEMRFIRACGWYFSPHVHMLGFLNGGYKCRKCKFFNVRSMEFCGECSEFEGLTRRLNVKDGWIVKVLGERKKLFGTDKPNVYGTAKYELGHCSYRIGAKRSNVVRYFGVVSYRKLKVVPVKEPCLCPHCKRELVEIKYVGNNPEILAWLGSRFSGVHKSSWLDYCKDGVPVWVENDSGEHRRESWRECGDS